MENVAPILIGIFMIVFAIRLMVGYKKMAASGQIAEGVIYGPAESGNGLIIRFKTTDGHWITGPNKNRISGSFMKVGDKVTVLYDSLNPNDFMIRTKYTNVLLAGFGFAGTGLIVLGLLGVGN